MKKKLKFILSTSLLLLLNTQLIKAEETGNFVDVGRLWSIFKPFTTDIFGIIKIAAVIGAVAGFLIEVRGYFNNSNKEEAKEKFFNHLVFIFVVAFIAFFAKEILLTLPFFKDYLG